MSLTGLILPPPFLSWVPQLIHVCFTSLSRPQLRLIHLPATIPIHAPTGTPPPPPGELLEDVKFAETVTPSEDVVMADVTPATTPGLQADSSMATITTNGASTPFSSPDERPSPDDDHKPPPMKRARMHSDADMASLAHVSLVSFLSANAGGLILYDAQSPPALHLRHLWSLVQIHPSHRPSTRQLSVSRSFAFVRAQCVS
jgi:hypothetical protein